MRISKPILRRILVSAGAITLAIFLVEGLFRIPALEDTFQRYPALAVPLAFFLLLVFILFLSDAMVKLTWNTHDLEQGELRARLESLARRAHISVPRILLEKDRVEANGFVLGLTERARCVVLTEHLIRSFAPEDVEGVFAHELGHARGGHLHYLLLLMAIFLLLSYPLVKASFGYSPWFGAPVLLIFSMGYWRFLFGSIARRFELEADVTAADLIGADSYRKAMRSSSEPRQVSPQTWRHPSIEDRLRTLKEAEIPGSGQAAFHARGIRLRRILFTLFLVSLALYGAVLAGEMLYP